MSCCRSEEDPYRARRNRFSVRTSGHYSAFTSVAVADLVLTQSDGLRWCRSSQTAERGSCERCGINLFWRPLTEPARISIAAGAATKAATNAVEGKPVGQGVATAAAVGSVVGTAGSVAGNKAAAAVGGEVGANAAAVTKVATQVISGAAKKETNCSISNGNPC